MMGGSNGGHHTKWMLESDPELFDGGIAGYGFNSRVSQWGSIATVLKHYRVIADRIDDIIANRAANPAWDPAADAADAAARPRRAARRRCGASQSIPATIANGLTFDVGRWPGSEGAVKSNHGALVGYSSRLDAAFRSHLQPQLAAR